MTGQLQLRRDQDSIPVVDHEIAKRGLGIDEFARGAGIHVNTMRRLRRGPGVRGGTATLQTAYKIARALDPEHAEEMVRKLFEAARPHD